MECNREEAARTKELATQKFSDNEYSAAKELALRAQAMCPELEGIKQFLDVLDVFISSEFKVGDETDWYEVLGVSSSSDKTTIKKQYKAKALTLHPDKNKSAGSTEAFKLMLSAYRILSDPQLRAGFDSRRNEQPPVKASEREHESSKSKVGSFWTFCKSCSRYLQYREIFRGRVLVCKCCTNPFVANEVSEPPTEEPKEGPSSSNAQPCFHHHLQVFSKPSFGFSNPSFQSSSMPEDAPPIKVYVRRRKRGRVSDEQLV